MPSWQQPVDLFGGANLQPSGGNAVDLLQGLSLGPGPSAGAPLGLGSAAPFPSQPSLMPAPLSSLQPSPSVQPTGSALPSLPSQSVILGSTWQGLSPQLNSSLLDFSLNKAPPKAAGTPMNAMGGKVAATQPQPAGLQGSSFQGLDGLL